MKLRVATLVPIVLALIAAPATAQLRVHRPVDRLTNPVIEGPLAPRSAALPLAVPEPDPSAPTATLVTTGTGNCTNGTHQFKLVYLTATGRTAASPASAAVTCDGTHKQVTVARANDATRGTAADGSVAEGSAAITGVDVYATKAGGSTFFLVGTSPVMTNAYDDPGNTTYTFNIADSAFLTTEAPTDNTSAPARWTVTGANSGFAPSNVKDDVIIGDGAFGTYAGIGNRSVMIGKLANSTDQGIAIGYTSHAGCGANVALGYEAKAGCNGVSIGWKTGYLLNGGVPLTTATTSGVVIGMDAHADVAFDSGANQFVAGSGSAAINNVWFGKGVRHATPTAYTINGTAGLGTNIAGGDIRIAGGIGTGTGIGGAIRLAVSLPGTTGSALNTLTDAVVTDHQGLGLKDLGTKPTCSASTRFKLWVDAGGAGVKDTVEVCAKDAGDVYAWRTIY